MYIIDYKEKTEPCDGVAINGHYVECDGADLSDVTFRNFPKLYIEELNVNACVFENCGTVSFEDCPVENCTFTRVDTLYAVRSPITGCVFANLRCYDDCVISLEDTNITACTFRDVALTDESYLIDGTGDVLVDNCKFEDIRTDREDMELFFCEETVGKIFKRKKQFSIVDEDSCTGLDKVVYTG